MLGQRNPSMRLHMPTPSRHRRACFFTQPLDLMTRLFARFRPTCANASCAPLWHAATWMHMTPKTWPPVHLPVTTMAASRSTRGSASRELTAQGLSACCDTARVRPSPWSGLSSAALICELPRGGGCDADADAEADAEASTTVTAVAVGGSGVAVHPEPQVKPKPRPLSHYLRAALIARN